MLTIDITKANGVGTVDGRESEEPHAVPTP